MTIIAFPKPATQQAEPRPLSYRYHDHRPAKGTALTEYLIEAQVEAAHLTGVPLATFSPMLDTAAVDQLLDLADAVHDAEDGPRAEFHACIDDYAFALRQLALAVRAGAR